jgi:cytochrome d ubiquinol oxidase subunit I
MSIAFHIVFAAIGIGIPLLLFISEGLWLATKNETYLQIARRWGRLFAVLFAVGAVSGTILSFELGLLWPRWMEFSGGIIGFLFTLEGIAFFTEAIFLALYVYGWDRLSPRAHGLCTVPLLFSSAASGVLVISVNAWMNQPSGFEVLAGQPVNVDPLAAMFNKAMPLEAFHGTMATYVATGFALAGGYAYAVLRGDRSEYNRKMLMLALAIGAISIPLQILSGDFSARFLARNQPEKFAAMEAQFKTEKGAPLHIGGIPDTESRNVRYSIEIPKLASLMTYGRADAEIRGLDSFPEDEVPDVHKVHYSFQVMVGVGFSLLCVAAWFWVAVLRKKRIEPGRRMLLAVVAAAPMGFVALEAGWFVTEFGRQPWVIYQVMRTSEGVTPQESIPFIFLGFIAVYVALAVGLGLILLRQHHEPA